MKHLYPHQEIGNSRIRAALLEGCNRLIVQAPTGCGKALMASDLIRPYAENGMRAIFCAAHLGLINQTIERFLVEGIDDIGVIQADHALTRMLWFRSVLYKP